MDEPDDEKPPENFNLFTPWRWDRTQQFGLGLAAILVALLVWMGLFRLSLFLNPHAF
jgi:hypothetical protein